MHFKLSLACAMLRLTAGIFSVEALGGNGDLGSNNFGVEQVDWITQNNIDPSFPNERRLGKSRSKKSESKKSSKKPSKKSSKKSSGKKHRKCVDVKTRDELHEAILESLDKHGTGVLYLCPTRIKFRKGDDHIELGSEDGSGDVDIDLSVICVEKGGCTIDGNYDKGSGRKFNGRGGFMQINSDVDVLFQDIKFTNFGASGIGGVFYFNLARDATFTRCKFTKCHSDWNGGVMYLSGMFDMVFEYCVFRYNDSGRNAGAILQDLSFPLYENSIFKANSASESGGGIYSFDSSVSFHNVKFRKNSAGDSGGAGFFDLSGGNVLNKSGKIKFVENTASTCKNFDKNGNDPGCS